MKIQFRKFDQLFLNYLQARFHNNWVSSTNGSSTQKISEFYDNFNLFVLFALDPYLNQISYEIS